MPVYVPHIERGPHPGVLEEIRAQGFDPIPVLTEQSDPYSYSSAIRRWWREGTGFIIVEQDAKPPGGALDSYAMCPADICSRPHNCRRDGVMGSLACVKFSSDLVTTFPDWADRVLARQRPYEWWRAGFLVNRPYNSGVRMPHDAHTACIRPEVVEELGEWPNPNWPTTQEWPHTDTVLFGWFERMGVPTHYHTTPSVCYPDPNEHFPGIAP